MSTPALKSLEKAIDLLGRIIIDGDAFPISALADEIGIKRSTAHRISATMERRRLILRVRRGYFMPGPVLLTMASPRHLQRVLIAIGQDEIDLLARQTGHTVHLGVLEGGMVTYLLKSGRRRAHIFTKQGTQLEAYCTGIGKVLLASLARSELDDYLADGPFVRLTPTTITSARALRAALGMVRSAGYAIDDAEMDPDLRCIAVPVLGSNGQTLAALSVSIRQGTNSLSELTEHLHSLKATSRALSQRLAPMTPLKHEM